MLLTKYRYRNRMARLGGQDVLRDAFEHSVTSVNAGDLSLTNPIASLVPSEEQVPGQPESRESDDFEIALVACRERPGLRRPKKIGRILLFPLTWRKPLRHVGAGFHRRNAIDPSMVLTFGDVLVNFLTMEISRSGEPVRLTAQAFKLLKFFSLQAQRVISRDELLREVWGYTNYPSTRTVDNHVLMLRKKLEPNPAYPVHFLTVHGMGYKFNPSTTLPAGNEGGLNGNCRAR